jgi:peptidoglycan/xylan/chitin deacetylase (PgdA/CDA1 family)
LSRKLKKKGRFIGLCLITALIITALIILLSCNNNREPQTTPEIPTPTVTPEETPGESTPEPEPSEIPSEVPDPEESNNNIRTDYEAFLPNEAGEIPIIMFHRFIEKYEPDTEKEYTTTFSEFEALLEELYEKNFRLISMKDFIDCNISVPAGTMPMVFTFDDGTPGQFNLIKEDGMLKANPKSALGIMIKFNEKHPDFGLKGIFYVNLDTGDNTFKGEGSLKERFEYLENLGFEIGNHTWGHVDYTKSKFLSPEPIQESLGKNQEKLYEILPGHDFYSLALPFGHRPKNESLWPYLQDGSYNSIDYHHDTIMAVGAEPSLPSISSKYNSLYVRRIRAQGREPVPADLTWWLPKMTPGRMFVSDGDPSTIVVPEKEAEKIDISKLNGKKLITY